MKFIFILFAATLAACGSKIAPVTTVQSALTTRVGIHATAGGESYSGQVRARHELALGFRTGGKIIERNVITGDRIKAGQVLARLDPADAALQLAAALAQFTLANNDVGRSRVLKSRGFISQAALDAKEAALQAARAQAGLARNQLDYTRLRAAHDGVVAATLAEAGQVVNAGQTVLLLAQSDAWEVAIDIPEQKLSGHHVGESAQVRIGDGAPIPGRVRELSQSADPASRTYTARIAFTASHDSALGMTAQVVFENSTVDALLIPLSALYQTENGAAVWIVAADGHVSLRAVKVKAYLDEGAVISSGLARGERIVTAGVHRLSNNEKIKILESAQ
jgi:RND family efflux transporter MFP subunit